MSINMAEAKARISAQTEGQEKISALSGAVKDLSEQVKRFAAEAGNSGNAAARMAAQAQAAGGKIVASASQQRAGMQQLSYQIGDVTQGLAAAAQASDPVKMAFMTLSQQTGQVVQAMVLMRGEATGLLGFLAGPWGSVIVAATAVLGPMILKLAGIGEEAKKAESALDNMIAKYRQAQAEKNRFQDAGDDLDKLLAKRKALEDRIKLVGRVNPANGQMMNVYKEQQDLKALNTQIEEATNAIDAERIKLLPLDRVMQGMGETNKHTAGHVRTHTAAMSDAEKAAQRWTKAEDQLAAAILRGQGAFEQRMAKMAEGGSLAPGMIGAPKQEKPTLWEQMSQTNAAAMDQIGASLEASKSPMQRGMEDYSKTIGDTAKSAADAWSKAFKGTEDALTNFVMTGKLNFKSLANSIIADMVRIAIQQTIMKPLMALFGFKAANGAVLSGGSVVAHANGGVFPGGNVQAFASGTVVGSPTLFPMSGGRTGLMGEAGPEAIMPLRRLPSGRLGVESAGGGGKAVNVAVSVDASGTQVQGNSGSAGQLGRLVGQAVQAELIRQQRPGGLLASGR